MQYRTLIESDGKTVFITSEQLPNALTRYLCLAISLVVLSAFILFPFWPGFRIERHLVLWLLMACAFVYPVLTWAVAMFMEEEVLLDTQCIRIQRRLGALRSRTIRKPFAEGQLATGSETLGPGSKLLRISWYEDNHKTKKSRLLYKHLFPMTLAQYEQTKDYVQELFDLEESDSFELLFSAN